MRFIKNTDFNKLVITELPEWPAIIIVFSLIDSSRILKLNGFKHKICLNISVDQT
jgi:hypothetical protein